MTISRLILIVTVLATTSAGLLPSSESHARSCPFVTKETAEERSHKYEDLVSMEINKQNAVYFVEVFLPSEIEGGPLSYVSLIKGTPDYGSDASHRGFTINLKVTKQENGRLYTSFKLKPEFANDIYISAAYAGSCGFEVIYAVAFGNSVESSATACTITSKKMVEERSQRYQDLIRLEINSFNDLKYSVDAFFPPEIMGQALSDIWLFKGKPAYGADKADHDFSMSLGVTEWEDGLMHSWYGLKAEYANDNYIGASYGGDCGLEVQYLVDFEKSVKR